MVAAAHDKMMRMFANSKDISNYLLCLCDQRRYSAQDVFEAGIGLSTEIQDAFTESQVVEETRELWNFHQPNELIFEILDTIFGFDSAPRKMLGEGCKYTNLGMFTSLISQGVKISDEGITALTEHIHKVISGIFIALKKLEKSLQDEYVSCKDRKFKQVLFQQIQSIQKTLKKYIERNVSCTRFRAIVRR